MDRKKINQLIGYGILTFTTGFILGLAVHQYFQILIPLGTVVTYVGIMFFFKSTKLSSELTKDPGEDVLTYFFNKIVLKFWTFVFTLWMLIMNIMLVTNGFFS